MVFNNAENILVLLFVSPGRANILVQDSGQHFRPLLASRGARRGQRGLDHPLNENRLNTNLLLTFVNTKQFRTFIHSSIKISIITSGVVICYLVMLRVLHFNCNKQIVLRL